MDVRYATSGEPRRDAFFDVWEGRDQNTGEPVLVHRLRESCGLEEPALRELVKEAGRASSLLHPHIVAVREARYEEGRPVVITALPRGQRLDSALAGGALRASRVARLSAHLCEGLAYAHERGVWHGGLTPSQVYLSQEREAEIAGFGTLGALARHPETTAYVRRQRVAFISPEEARGGTPIASSDIYALGVMLFRMATGRLPFVGPDPLAVARAHCEQPAPRPSEWAPGLPEALERCIVVALEKDPARRYASVKDLLLELRRIADDLEREEARAETQMAEAAMRLPEEALTRREAAKALTWVLGRGLLGLLLTLAGTLGAVTLVFLLLASPRHEVVVPDVIGMSEEEAKERLAPLGLELVAADEEYSEEVPPGGIARMITPYAGKKVRRGRQVRVSISRGRRKLRVPHVVDLDVDEAKKKIEAAELRAGQIVQEHSSMVPEGIVLRQQPGEGTRVPEGTALRLVVSKGPKELPRRDPDKMYSFLVKVRVPEGGEAHRVRIDVEDEDGATRMVYSELHLGGELAERKVVGKGNFVVRVYLDDELVREVKTGGE